MVNKPLRGQIWWVRLDPTEGREQAKTRPCLIISNNLFNAGPSELIVVAPLTSREKKIDWRIKVQASNAALKDSWIMTDQIRTISVSRLAGSSLGTVSDETMEQVEVLVRVLLDL